MGFALQKVNTKLNIFAIHGFLGKSSDWDQFKKYLPDNFNLIALDLFSANESNFNFSSFEILTEQIFQESQKYNGPKVIIGYSLGGRIALHLLQKYSKHFEKFIFLSTHAGLESETEILSRKKNDYDWSLKLDTMEWIDFLKLWNAQPVFKGSTEPRRIESQFNKDKLSQALVNLSLSEQKNMNEVILQNKNKIVWVVGSLDQKFLNLAEELKQKKILENYSRILCSHRILFEKPDEIVNLLK